MRYMLGALLAAIVGLAAIAYADSAPNPDDLLGTWMVDLRPTPDAKPYYQEFVVSEVTGSSFRGTFYGTAIENAHINKDWGRLHFAFTTEDGSGTYSTSGVLDGGKMTGTTHSLGRGFLTVWKAEHVEEEKP